MFARRIVQSALVCGIVRSKICGMEVCLGERKVAAEGRVGGMKN